jgi:hypothetical protein
MPPPRSRRCGAAPARSSTVHVQAAGRSRARRDRERARPRFLPLGERQGAAPRQPSRAGRGHAASLTKPSRTPPSTRRRTSSRTAGPRARRAHIAGCNRRAGACRRVAGWVTMLRARRSGDGCFPRPRVRLRQAARPPRTTRTGTSGLLDKAELRGTQPAKPRRGPAQRIRPVPLELLLQAVQPMGTLAPSSEVRMYPSGPPERSRAR